MFNNYRLIFFFSDRRNNFRKYYLICSESKKRVNNWILNLLVYMFVLFVCMSVMEIDGKGENRLVV